MKYSADKAMEAFERAKAEGFFSHFMECALRGPSEQAAARLAARLLSRLARASARVQL